MLDAWSLRTSKAIDLHWLMIRYTTNTRTLRKRSIVTTLTDKVHNKQTHVRTRIHNSSAPCTTESIYVVVFSYFNTVSPTSNWRIQTIKTHPSATLFCIRSAYYYGHKAAQTKLVRLHHGDIPMGSPSLTESKWPAHLSSVTYQNSPAYKLIAAVVGSLSDGHIHTSTDWSKWMG